MKFEVTSKPVEEPQPEKYVKDAEGVFHQGMLFGAISNGDCVITMSDGKALKFIRDGSQFVTIELLNAGCGKQVKHQQWRKTKVVKERVEVQKTIPQQKRVMESVKINEDCNVEEVL
jgi:hypothetical protein